MRAKSILFVTLFGSVMLFTAIGCATQPAPVTAASDVECVTTTRVGSNIPVKSCGPPMTEAERQQMLTETQNMVRANGGKATGQ